MAVVQPNIDSAITDGTGTYSGVQFASVSRAQQIYHVSATNDYRAVNWHTPALTLLMAANIEGLDTMYDQRAYRALALKLFHQLATWPMEN